MPPQNTNSPLLTTTTTTTTNITKPNSKTATYFVFLFVFLFLFHTNFNTSPPSTYHSLFLSLGSNATAASHLHALTLRPHVAGTRANFITASYVFTTLTSYSFPSHSTSYSVLLSYPTHRSLSLTPGPTTKPISFPLTQHPYPTDPSSAYAAEVIPTFLAYAASGSVSAAVVYANYGRVEDFEYLSSIGVNVTGKITLAKYGKIFRGDIVTNSRNAGAAAAVIYTDDKDYGGDGGKLGERYPDGPWMPPSGVQVGSTFNGVGDPTTPMWASTDGCERVDLEQVLASDLMPGIPALPVSGQDGETIHRAIGGPVAPEDWQGSAVAPVYRIGPGPGVINLTNIGNETLATIHDVFAVIEGKEEPDRYVILGNHRDAWTFGGVDPSSGTAALLELAQRLSMLKKRGWRPRRTIILCNWDAEEYALIGSTEWVEENRQMLSSRAVAYLNVDESVSGPGFTVSATPQLDELIVEASKLVQDPENATQTVYESWAAFGNSPSIGRLGGGGTDHVAFIQHVGVSSVNLGFWESHPVYHSMYDDFMWMENFGDPLFKRHVAAASIWGLIALRLADDEILPFNYLSYALELEKSAKVLEDRAPMPISFSPLYKSIKELKVSASKIDLKRKELQKKKWGFRSRNDPSKVRELNDRLMMAERAFTDGEGLFGRPWYKHLIYGPSKYNSYGSTSYPGIDDAIEQIKKSNTSDSWQFAQHEIFRVARAINQASLVLSGGLT